MDPAITYAPDEVQYAKREISRAEALHLWNKDGLGKPAAPEDCRGSSS